jgi:hypothetical protein
MHFRWDMAIGTVTGQDKDMVVNDRVMGRCS